MGGGEDDHDSEGRLTLVGTPGPRHRKGNVAVMVAVLARGGTQAEAAAAAGISEREVRRRQHEPAIQEQIREVRSELSRRAQAAIAGGCLEAVNTLRALLGPDQTAELRVRASKELLHAGVRTLESLEVTERFEQLEAKIRGETDAESDA
jgi:hypothetical protein